MRIQLTSRDPSAIGGVQSWVRIMAPAFRDLGHTIVGHDTPADLGIMGSRVWPEGATKVIQVCHGILEHERPDHRAHAWAFVSEESGKHWKGTGPIVRQPLHFPDSRWDTPTHRTDGPIIRFSYYGGLNWLPGMVESLGRRFLHIQETPFDDALPILQTAACVVASGRAALECAAHGIPVLILDSRTYQGTLCGGMLGDWYQQEVRVSCSGRTGKAEGEWVHEIQRARVQNLLEATTFERFCPPIDTHHPHTVARQLLDLARTVSQTVH